jgi:hypothetical protein
MSSFDIEPEQLVVFEVDDEYLFSQYFDHTDLFEGGVVDTPIVPTQSTPGGCDSRESTHPDRSV